MIITHSVTTGFYKALFTAVRLFFLAVERIVQFFLHNQEENTVPFYTYLLCLKVSIAEPADIFITSFF